MRLVSTLAPLLVFVAAFPACVPAGRRNARMPAGESFEDRIARIKGTRIQSDEAFVRRLEIFQPGRGTGRYWQWLMQEDTKAFPDGLTFRLAVPGELASQPSAEGIELPADRVREMEEESLNSMLEQEKRGFFTADQVGAIRQIASDWDPGTVTWLRIQQPRVATRMVSLGADGNLVYSAVPGSERVNQRSELTSTYLRIVRGQAEDGLRQLPWEVEVARTNPAFVARYRPDRRREKFIYEIGRAVNHEDPKLFEATFAMGMLLIAQDVLARGGRLEDAYVYGHTADPLRGRHFGMHFPLRHLGYPREGSQVERLFRSPLVEMLNDRRLRAMERFAETRSVVEALRKEGHSPAEAFEKGIFASIPRVHAFRPFPRKLAP